MYVVPETKFAVTFSLVTMETRFSSESNFTLALTPAGLHKDLETTISDIMPPVTEFTSLSIENGGNDDFHSFSEVFQPLNLFKLNEYRARIDQVLDSMFCNPLVFYVCELQDKASKLSKLGITRTSQISLEGDGTGFSTGVLEMKDGTDKSPSQSADGILDSNGCKPETETENSGMHL